MLILLLFALIGCSYGIQLDNTNKGNTETEIRLKNLETLVYRQSLLLSEQSNRIQNLETTVAFQRSEIEELKTNLDSVKHKQSRHGEKISVLKKLLQKKSLDNDFLKEKTHPETPNYMDKTESRTIEENIPVNRYQRLLIGNPSSNRTPAFYAYMSKNENNHGPHHTLKFDIVVTSTDSAYNPLTGVYTVKTSGVYVFTFNVRLGCHAYGSFELIQNANAKGSVFLETSDTCDRQHATAVVVLDTKQGDVIYVRTHSSYGGSGDIESDDKGSPTSSSDSSKPDVAKYDAPDAEFFAGIPKISLNKDAAVDNSLVYKHYDANKVVMGKTMEEWLRFSVCFWHTFRGTGADPFGFPTLFRPWDDGSDSMANAKRRLRAAFEFFTKLGVKYYTFHDRDVAPEGATLAESNKNLDEITDLALELQKKTGVKLLWATCNLFAHSRYMNGAGSNPNADILAYAAAQVKKGLEVAKKLGAENFVFWGGREGYHTLLNTNILTEMTNMASFFKMAAAYKKKIGFTGPLLIEPKPKEPSKHQYDYDAMTVIGFLKHFGLENDYKLNIEPNHTTLAGHCYEHDIVMSSAFGMLGSIDSNTGSPDLGWDTDQFPMDAKNATMVMKTVLEQNGIQPGGLNFDCKVRRESTDLKDMFISHIGAMDTFARGLEIASKILTDGVIPKQVKERYSSYDTGVGQKINKVQTSFEELEEYIMKKGEPEVASGRQEHYESMLNSYM